MKTYPGTYGPTVGEGLAKLTALAEKLESENAVIRTAMPNVSSVLVKVPGLKIKSESNKSRHEPWQVTKRRVDSQHKAVAAWLIGHTPPAGLLTVVFTRLYTGRAKPMDAGGNLGTAFKAVQDAMAKWLGRDDGDGTVDWQYRQQRADENAVVIAITNQGAK